MCISHSITKSINPYFFRDIHPPVMPSGVETASHVGHCS